MTKKKKKNTAKLKIRSTRTLNLKLRNIKLKTSE